jgi:transposase
VVAQTGRKFDAEFRAGVVRIVTETGKPIAQVARHLGINEGTLGTGWPRTGPPGLAMR